jgi:hypothetical protein
VTERGSWGVFVAAALMCILILLASRLRFMVRERERRRKFASWSRAGGFRYLGSQAWNVADQFPGLRLPFARECCVFSHVFSGEIESLDGRKRSAWWGELTYSVGAAHRIRTLADAFVIIDLGSRSLSPVEIRPTEPGDRLGSAIGWEPLRFESVEFADRFHVTGVDKRFTWSLLDPRLMQALLEAPRGLSVAVGGSWIAFLRLVGESASPASPFVRLGPGVSIADLEAIRDESVRLLAMFPRTLIPPGDSP